MSGYRTHMLIGGVGGLAAYRLLDRFQPDLANLRVEAFHESIEIPQLVIAAAFVVLAAYLALWPDIDEPGSKISILFRFWLPPCVGAWVVISSLWVGSDPTAVAVAAILATIGAIIMSAPILAIIHQLAGGHRRLTHSLILGLGLLAITVVLELTGQQIIGLPFGLLGFGLLLHLLGDIVTPGGVPIFYPLSKWEFHALPAATAEFGEPLIACLMLAFGAALILV